MSRTGDRAWSRVGCLWNGELLSEIEWSGVGWVLMVTKSINYESLIHAVIDTRLP